jgi:SAM-dependent methyltransferase
MTSVTFVSEHAATLGELWGARAADWSATEERNAPSYEAALAQLPPLAGRRVLDLGCGAGVFLHMAAGRGARVAGVDASPGLLAEAARRVPDADLRLGELDRLPFDDDGFDVVTAFSSIFFALDPVEALRETGRVARPGALVVIQVWGREERCSLLAMKRAAADLREDDLAATPTPLAAPGVLEGMAAEAGLTPERAFDAEWAFEYASEDELARGMLSAASGVAAARAAGEEAARAAVLDALAPFRTADGAYRLPNEYHYLLARA